MADTDGSYDRRSTLSVARGLHIFRYVNFQGSGVPATARVMPPEGSVTILDMPGRERGTLQRPGDCLVLRAERAAEVTVGLRRGEPGGALDASFRIEPVVLAEEAAADRAPAGEPAAVSFLAHLSRRGDVAFAQGEWAGGPDQPAVVEGLEIVAASGSPVELQALVGSRPPRWSEWVGAGQFAGTRGHGLSLLGVRLRMKPEAEGVEIAAEALFLGALVASQRGRQVEFVSASGVDPLIGVKFALQSGQETGRSGGAGEIAAREREPRVRVFRASASR